MVRNVNSTTSSGVMASTQKNSGLTAAATASTTAVMAGFAQTYTPKDSGTLVIIFTGTGTTANAVAQFSVQGAYGTGSAPAQGAATPPAGFIATFGSAKVCRSPGAGVNATYMIIYVLTGLTVGTTYWFDVQYFTSTAADTAALQATDCIIFERPW